MRALFIAIEGIDFVGKTTVAKLLAERNDWLYYKTPPEPYASRRKYYDRLPTAERFEFFAEALVFASSQITAAVNDGRTVVADRWVWTTAAYHLAKEPALRVRAQKAITDVRSPDVGIYLEITDAKLWRERAASCGGARTTNDRELLGDAALRTRIEEGFLELNPSFIRVDNTGTVDATLAIIETATANVDARK